MANAIEHERGARHGPVGIVSGSLVCVRRTFGSSSAGKFVGAEVAAAGRPLAVLAERDEVILTTRPACPRRRGRP